MNKTNLGNFLTDQTKLKAQKRELKNLAQLLALKLHINQGDHLVRFLGDGTEKNNVEAVAYWLAQHGHYIEDMKAIEVDPLNRLHNELIKKLLSLELGV